MTLQHKQWHMHQYNHIAQIQLNLHKHMYISSPNPLQWCRHAWIYDMHTRCVQYRWICTCLYTTITNNQICYYVMVGLLTLHSKRAGYAIRISILWSVFPQSYSPVAKCVDDITYMTPICQNAHIKVRYKCDGVCCHTTSDAYTSITIRFSVLWSIFPHVVTPVAVMVSIITYPTLCIQICSYAYPIAFLISMRTNMHFHTTNIHLSYAV